MNIAYLGIPGSYSHSAAMRYFAGGDSYIGCKTFSLVFKSIADGLTEQGIVALENSIHGSVVETYDLLEKYKLSIIGEVYLRINHCLVTVDTVAYEDLTTIKECYSHPQAIGQCEDFFQTHPWIEAKLSSDTASAAKDIQLWGRRDVAAISSSQAASIYQLHLVKDHLADTHHNYTRFAVIAAKPNVSGEKISLSFSLAHEPGSLLKALTPYAKYGLNLMKVESRPIPEKPWEYTFFCDLEIGTKEQEAEAAIQEMNNATYKLKILGRYAKGETYEA